MQHDLMVEASDGEAFPFQLYIPLPRPLVGSILPTVWVNIAGGMNTLSIDWW